MPALHALLLTDVVDSTKLTEQLGDAAMGELWIIHDRVARDLLPLWRGREIDKTDGMLLLFDDVRDAVGYALAYHRALAARGLPFKARAGIHVGPVGLRPNPPADVARGAKPVEVDGLALPIAARVMSVALGAQTLLSADARLALGVAPQRVVSHGHWRMHGVADPVELFEIGEVGDAGDAPFQAPPDGPKVYRVMRQGDLWQPVREVRHSVPAERDSFVGRHEPLQLLAKKFEDGARLVSVLGMGGTGKTRLATRFAWTWLGDYPGGVWFCDLSQARTLDGIHFAVAQGLDVPLGKADPVVQLAHAIAGRGRCLVILDNFEQVARHAEATLGRWLDRAPLAQFIVTTREVLGIVGEEMLALEPLPVSDAVMLFERRARAAQSGFRIASSDRMAVEQLVQVLDGMPLAIELAAARARVMSPRTLLLRMNERFKLLWSSATRHDHHATLRAAFDWSWELLSTPERAALAQLSTFEGSFALEAAEGILEVNAVGAASPVDVLYSLVDKSFVRRRSEERFDLLQSVRAYAAEHLCTQGRYPGSGPQAREACEKSHGAFFGAEPERNVVWCHDDLDNLVAACRRAAARGDGRTAAAALSGAWGPLRLRGPFRLGYELAMLVRAMPELEPRARMWVTFVAGASLDLCGNAKEAMQEFTDALASARSLGSKQFEATATNGLARLQAHHGMAEEADASFQAALRIAREIDMPALKCTVLNNLGSYCEATGRLDEAGMHYLAALDIAVRAQDRRWESGSAGNLGQFYANHGRSADARVLYERAVAIAHELGDRQWEANGRCNLGLLHHQEGRFESARSELQAALTAARDLGHRRLLAVVQCNLGLVAEARAQASTALACYEEAIAIARENLDRRSEGQFGNCLGTLHAREGRFDVARACLNAAADSLATVGDKINLALVHCSQVETECRAGDGPAAREALRAAETIATELPELSLESELGKALRQARTRSQPIAASEDRTT